MILPALILTPSTFMRSTPDMTAEAFAQRVFDLDLLDDEQLRAVWSELGSRKVTLARYHQAVLRLGLMTSHQVNRVMRGERDGYFYGDYKVLYQVGAGTFARAFRAVHKETGAVVAIKALRKRHAADPEVTGQFSREGAVGCLLRHPNIVPIYEVVAKDDEHYLVMEFIEGRTLRQFLKTRKRLGVREAVQMMRDIVAGLAYAAERGITHRDIKASNIVVTSRGEAKLLDFGLAAVSQTKRTHLIEEGPNPRAIDYVGVERLGGVRKNDPRSDLYFAGCLMYHMLAGKPALTETTDRARRLSKARFTDVVPLTEAEPELPRYVSRVCEKAMDLNVAKRYQRASDFLADLDKALKRLAIDQPPEPSHEESQAASIYAGDTLAPPRTNGHGPLPRAGQTVLVVELNDKMQDVFRQAFYDSGYEVLVTSDPQRAVSLLDEDPRLAQCVVVCASELGDAALDAFNRLGVGSRTAHVPAVLLLGRKQAIYQSRAQVAPHRIVIASPMRVRDLRELVARLLRQPG